jgi:hypothetical protein
MKIATKLDGTYIELFHMPAKVCVHTPATAPASAPATAPASTPASARRQLDTKLGDVALLSSFASHCNDTPAPSFPKGTPMVMLRPRTDRPKQLTKHQSTHPTSRLAP